MGSFLFGVLLLFSVCCFCDDFVLSSRIALYCNDKFWVTWSNLEDAETTLNL